MKNNNALFYTCSLIEYIGREKKMKRSDVVCTLGENTIGWIYRYPDVFHSTVNQSLSEETRLIDTANNPFGV